MAEMDEAPAATTDGIPATPVARMVEGGLIEIETANFVTPDEAVAFGESLILLAAQAKGRAPVSSGPRRRFRVLLRREAGELTAVRRALTPEEAERLGRSIVQTGRSGQTPAE